MGDKTAIEWTRGDDGRPGATLNPITGCTRVSPACDMCYIERTPPLRMAGRKFDKPGVGGKTGVMLHPERLLQPIRWTRGRRIFWPSLGDWCHADVPDDFIATMFAVMALTRRHTYMLLTKRHDRMRSLVNSVAFQTLVGDRIEQLAGEGVPTPEGHPHTSSHWWPLPNVWLGVTAENQQYANLRIPVLLETHAKVRFISAEPLLGPINLTQIPYNRGAITHIDVVHGLYGVPGVWKEPGRKLDWLITGGESGHQARPSHPDWFRDLRDQCVSGGVPYFHKQHGEWGPAEWKLPRGEAESVEDYKARSDRSGATHAINRAGYHLELDHKPWSGERSPAAPAEWAGLRRWGKKAAGRQLDGREWTEFPNAS